MIIQFNPIGGGGQGGGVTTGEVQTMIASALTPYYTSVQTNTAINNAVSGKSDTSALTNYTTTAYTQDLELSVAGSLNLKENLSNKVTVVTSASTDVQYPSAKAVYDALSGATGGITSGEVQTMIDSSLTPYYTSAQTHTAISSAVSDKVSSSVITTIWKGTQAQYDAIPVKDYSTFYIIV